MARYQDPDWKDQKPPTLIGEGARVNPEWLMRFLNNPALSETDTNRDGVRQYLQGAHADLQLLRRRDPQARALLRGALVAGGAVHRRSSWSRSPIRSAPWRGSCSPAKARPA